MPGVLRTLAKLLADFKSSDYVTPADFLESSLREYPFTQNEDQHFLHLIKHEEFLDRVASRFIDNHKLRRIGKINVKVLLYFIIFVLDQTNYCTILNVELFYVNKLLIFLIDESNHIPITQHACTIFENEYVLENIMYPLLDKLSLVQALLKEREDEEYNRIVKRGVTVPKEFTCFSLGRCVKISKSVETRASVKNYKLSTRRIDNELFFYWSKLRKPQTGWWNQKKPPAEPAPVETKVFKAKKIPTKKNVEIKGNLTTTLREATRFVKEQEEEIKRIDDIIKGGVDPETTEQIELELRKEKQQKELEDIERKHLQSLLTYEEAILAKQKLLEDNKMKTMEFKEVKAELLRKLEQMKKEEQEKIRMLVEKSQKIKTDAKLSEKKLQEEKQNHVRLIQYESRELLKKAYEEQKRELERKVELIQEIRTLHQIRCNMNVKEYDPTECPNFGLLCEMSIAELQERLAVAKVQMKEELKEKRDRILKRKQQQQEMLENVKNFIAQTRRMSKPSRSLPICSVNLERSPDLDELRRQLEEKRSLRMNSFQVNVGSPAERAGLVAGDAVIKINNTDVFNLRHKDAQDVVVRAGNAFEVTLQRGGSTWKPSVIPTGSFPTPTPAVNNVSPVTRTSLAAPRSENIGSIGTGHNLSAKPFSPQVNGAVNGGPKLVNKQYNSPLKLYSEESIAETLSAQTEVLSTGVLGVNFKKNEKNYDASNSAVLRMLKETENEPRTPDEEPESGVVTAPNSGIAGLRHVKAPENRAAPANPQLPPGQNICAECERLIVGVFVRIKEKNLHVECFKCSTCGTSLKNVGYYNISNKLYCDIHAKSAAIRINANPNLAPVTVPPGGKPPVQAISSALSSHSLPSPSPLSPKLNSFSSPYQPQETKENADVSSTSPLPNLSTNVTTEANNNNSLLNNPTPLSFSKYLNKSSTSFSGPKPFSSVTAPLSPASTLPRGAPLSPITPTAAPSYNAPSYTAPAYKAPSYSPASSAGRSAQGIVWPPPQEEPELPTACPLFYPPPSQVEQVILSKRAQREAEIESNWSECLEVEEINSMAQFLPKMSLCSEEVSSFLERKSAVECIETISETLETQRLVENVLKTTTQSVPSIEADIRPASPKSDTPQPCPVPLPDTCYQRKDSCDLKRPTAFTPNTIECQLPCKIDNAVPQKWESPLTQALRTTEPDPDTFSQIPSKHSSSALASALAVAPSLPFTPAFDPGKPVPLPEETVPYMPPEHPVLPPEPKEVEAKPKQSKPKSQFVKALETAPERPFTPVAGTAIPVKKKPKDPTDKYFEELPKPQERVSMLAALTTAPERSYSPLIVESVGAKQTEAKTQTVDKSQLTRPLKPDVLPTSFQVNKKEPKPPSYYSPAVLYQRTEESKSEEHTEETHTSETRTIERQTIHNPQVTQLAVEDTESEEHNIAPMFQAVSCYYHNKKDNITIEISTTPPVPTPPPKPATPAVKTIEAQPGYIEKEVITEEKTARQQTTKRQEQFKEEIRTDVAAVKQAEEVVRKKPIPPVQLHKPEGLPSYQVQLSENAEADLKLMEKVQKAQSRLEEQKQARAQESHTAQQCLEHTKKPIITIEPDTPNPRSMFKPVVEDRPSSTTFSPRPRSVTPSMINRPPPVLPYYQSSLVPQHMRPVTSNLLDPTSPGISRSPSPCPGARSRSPSPFPCSGEQNRPRAVSPAPGPPENPLKSPQPLPTPRDSRLEQARENITTFIPEYKSKRDLIEKVQGAERSIDVAQSVQSIQPTQIYVSQVHTQSFPLQQSRVTECESVVSATESLQRQKDIFEAQKLDVQEAQRAERYTSATAEGVVDTEIAEQSHSARLQQLRQCQSQSIEKSSDGSRQVQRKTTVTEEKYPFREVNAPSIEAPGATALHLTNPQPLSLPRTLDQTFLQQQNCLQQQSCAQQSSSACRNVCKETQPPQPVPAPPPPPPPTVKHVFAPSSLAPLKHVEAPGSSSKKPSQNVIRPNVSQPNAGVGAGRQAGGISVVPKRGRGVLNTAAIGGARIPLCEHASELCHANETENFIELDQVSLQLPTRPPPPPPVPVFSQINITIPYQSASPQLDSIGSSPRSDYSSYSSSSSKNPGQIQSTEAAREKILSEIRSLTPKLKKVNVSGTQSPRMNYIVNNVETTVTNNVKKVKSELLIPVNDYNNSKDHSPLPDHLTFANRPDFDRAPNEISKTYFGSGVTKDAKDYKSKDNFPEAPICWKCNTEIVRGPFITALGKIWCPNHFICTTPSCRRPLQDLGFVEEQGQLYCEYCFEQYLAPPCSKCSAKIKGDCLKAIGKNFHPECFNCVYCGKLFGNSPFFLEDGSPYCEADWNELFTTKCFACGFPVEAGDRWVEALNNNYHSQCFNCTMCKKNLEGQSFFAKGGRPFCKNHAR
ncbi:hypothetical protein NQ315_017056 [Exocentrus adspersus]|uniref:PDZ and LIM domain protein Zasp n=1 Tax=Exocentrus adspersus TaxID=1586481 RepID=A0AAV8VHZ1_9CUCU|nr:hypothetical protein NQ315_017056 [Exocentrus adspersus]